MRPLPVVLAAAALMLSCSTDQERQPPESDSRTAIDLPPAARDAVRAEMRLMLNSIHELLDAAARNDAAAMAEAAEAAGTAAAVDTDPEVERRLPPEFAALGMRTHQAFDSLAESIRDGAARDTVLARLGELTGNCVACHATYRLAAPRSTHLPGTSTVTLRRSRYRASTGSNRTR